MTNNKNSITRIGRHKVSDRNSEEEEGHSSQNIPPDELGSDEQRLNRAVAAAET